jgi:hypothetical protein
LIEDILFFRPLAQNEGEANEMAEGSGETEKGLGLQAGKGGAPPDAPGGQGTAKAELQLSQEDREELRHAIETINRLIAASKSLSLYPMHHPVAQEALSMLSEALQRFLHRYDEFTLSVKRETLVYRHWALGAKVDSFRSFASTLRHLNVSRFSILPGTEEEELRSFLQVLAADPEKVELQGGIETHLFVSGVTHIAVDVSESREKYEEDEEEEEGAAGERRPADLLDVLEEALKGFAQRVQELAELLKQPEYLAFSLRHLTVRGTPITQLSQLVEGMYLFLKKSAEIIEKQFAGRRSDYYRCMAEAILFLDTSVRNELLLRQLLPNLREDPFTAELLSSFTTQEISDVLSYFLPTAQELIPKTRPLLRFIGYSPEQVEEAVEMLKDKLIENGDVSPSLVYALEAGMEKEASESPPRKLPTLEEVAEFFREYSEEDIQAISAISDLDLERELIRQSAPVLLNLLRRGEEVDNLGIIYEQLEEGFWKLLEMRQLDLAAELLDEFKRLLGNVQPAFVPLRQRMLLLVNEAASPAAIRAVIQSAAQHRDEPGVLEGFKEYMRVLREDGVIAMINVLGDEEDMTLRKFINDVMVELCRGYDHLLIMRMQDDRWYLVRNLISILGRIRSTAALPSLRQTLYHTNPKVRAETVRALGFIGGYEAGSILLEGLSSPDQQTRVLCIRWLGRLEERRALGPFYQMLDSLKDNRTEDLEVKKEIVIALGRSGNLDTFPVLERYLHMSKFGYREQWEEINMAAEQSLRQLQERFPHAKGRRR